MSEVKSGPSGIWRGPALISVALLVLGIATYGYLTVAARVLDPAQYGQLAAFWSLVFAVLAGSCAPLEVEGTRAVSAARAGDLPVGPVVVRLAWLAVLLTAAVVLVLALARTILADSLFDGDERYVSLLGAVAVAFAVIYLGRGIFAGHQLFGRYGVLLAGEGVVRLALTLALVVAGVVSGPAIASAVPASAWLVAAVTAVLTARIVWQRRQAPFDDGPDAERNADPETRGVAANFGSLLLASLASQGLNNAGPITAQALGDDPALTGGLLAAFILVRVPVMFISALQSGFIPGLVTSVRRGDQGEFRELLRGVLVRVGAVGGVAVAAAGLAGPFVVGLFFGTVYQLQGVDFALLTLATVVFVLASVLQAALVALDLHKVVAGAWVIGLLLYLLALALPIPLLRQVEVGYLVGTFGVCLLLALGLFLRGEAQHHELRRQSQAQPEEAGE
jgi:O-antigen/teichoic acid export membrane protein